MIAGKDILNRAHGALVFGRRVRILAANLAKEIPIRAEVLDVGTGDGSIAKAIALHRPDIKIEGIDVLQSTDAMGTAVLEIRFRGCSQASLYNGHRPHSSLDGRTPDQAYFNSLPFRAAA